MPERILAIDLPPGRVFGLDLLRAAAILFVVYMHGAYELASVLPKSLVQLPIMDGVSMFFVLSGFLIGGIILRAFETSPPRPRGVGRIWIRRWFRTLPNYFLILTILVVHHLATTEALFSARSGATFCLCRTLPAATPRSFPRPGVSPSRSGSTSSCRWRCCR